MLVYTVTLPKKRHAKSTFPSKKKIFLFKKLPKEANLKTQFADPGKNAKSTVVR